MLDKNSQHPGFTLVELLVVVAILALLVSMLLPSLGRAKFLAKVTQAKAELSGIATALEVYYGHNKAYPPSRTYCEYGGDAKVPDWAELPGELAHGGYLPTPPADSHLTVSAIDPFNPNRTYKYLAPGKGYHNGAGTITGLWVPDDFPDGNNSSGKTWTNPKTTPVKFVLWSVGTYGDIGYWRALEQHHPLAQDAWYPGESEKGLIVRSRLAEGQYATSP